MNTDNAKALAETALNSLVEAVQQGRSEAVKTYLETLSRFHKYSFRNQMLIALQRPSATHVAGFHTWRSVDRCVRKGEKGIAILAPMSFKAKPQGDDGSEEQAAHVRFRAVTVFDVAQTDGAPLPEIGTTTGDPGANLERLAQFIASAGITVEYSDSIRPDLGTSTGGHITIALGLTSAEQFSVTVHELAHELLHRGTDRPASLTVRETEAEATAYTVCHHIGLNTGTAAHDYIALYDGDRGALIQSLNTIRDAATRIIAALDAAPEAAQAAR
jgi:antirestriction protein ArdC